MLPRRRRQAAAPPSWGGMLNQAVDFYQVDPMFMIVPGLAIFITVLAFNLLGDGLRDALDPRRPLTAPASRAVVSDGPTRRRGVLSR